MGPSKEIVLAGEMEDQKTKDMLKILYQKFFPNKVVTFRPSSDEDAQEIIALVPFVENQRQLNQETTAYVCENHQCKKPTSDLKEFEMFLESGAN